MGYIYASIPAGAAIILLFAVEKLLERYVSADNGAVSDAADPPP